MALLFMDGFDHIDDGYELTKWDSAIDITCASGLGRTGGFGINLYGGGKLKKYFSHNPTTLITGMACKFESFSTSTPFLSFHANEVTQVSLYRYSDGSLVVKRYTTVIGTSAVGVIPAQTWGYIEFKVLFSNTVGTIDVKVDGVSVISETGLDTCYEGSEYANRLTINTTYVIHDVYFDDLYVCDGAGTINNDFLGDVTISPLYPTSDGTYSDFTPSAGVDHYALVDDPQLSDDIDHIESGTVGHKDTFGVTTFPGSDVIHGVQINVATRNTDVGSLGISTLLISGITPTETDGSTHMISQTPSGTTSVYEKEPIDDAVWTATTIGNAEFGVKVKS